MNKIFAWGGDHVILEQSFSSLLMAKDMLSEALSDMVDRGSLDRKTALAVARSILHDNGRAFWRLDSSAAETDGRAG
jgi:hypothetical protein